MNKNIYLCFTALFACVQGYGDVVNLEPIKVTTASLGAEKNIQDVQASIEVLDRDSIEKSNAKSVPQLLNNALGLYVRDGGSTSSVVLRGFDSSHTLLLVDGLRRTGKYGTFDLTSVQLEDIERIEIVRGPMSALYGADGISGVVNIITKKRSKRDYIRGTILGGIAQNGQRDTYIARMSGSKVLENSTHNFSVEARKKEDYREDKSSVNTDLRNESRLFLSYANGLNITENDSLHTRFEYSMQDDDGRNYADTTTYEKEKRYQFTTQYERFGNKYMFNSDLAYGYSDAKINRGTGLETTKYGQLEFNNYFRHFTTDNMTNIVGVGYKRDDIEVSMYTKEATRDNMNALFQNEYFITESLSTNVGVRYDYFSDFGSSINPKLSIMYKNSGFSIRTTYGTAFKAPSFTNMYSHFTRSAGPVVYDISGNPDLDPEESKTYEISLGYNKDNLGVEITHHRTKLDNLINSHTVRYDPTTKTSYVAYENIDKAKINGVELLLKYKFDNKLAINLSWEYLDTEDKSTHERLTGSPRNSYKLDLTYEIYDFNIYFAIKRYDDFYDSNIQRENVNSNYTIADVKLNYNISKNFNWFIGIDNIQNRIMPYNMAYRGTPNDPGERYYYTGIDFSF